MESSDAETGIVECGVGTIVWVRRRNGSWWPGKILGPDELSASHLMSPRSGTPVKLLGREDASVDWYNLEKSKRVKAFRCGEFDDCIERAEASQGMPPKKREKYARREDAILHALELEKQVLEKKYGKSGVKSNAKLRGNVGKDTTLTPEISCDNGKHVNSLVEKGNKSPDVRPGSIRDLGGLAPIPLKCKLSSLPATNGSHKHAANADGVSKNMLEKRKRPQERGNMGESAGKRRDRRRPLVQVLESSAKLPLQSKEDGVGEEHSALEVKPGDSFDLREIQVEKFEKRDDSSEENTTGSNEDTETDSSGTESLISDTMVAPLSDEGEHMEFIPKAFGRCEGQGEDESMSDEESGVPDESGESLVAVSKWQLKGKRNSRGLTKRKVAATMSSGHWMSFKGEDTSQGFDWDEEGYWDDFQFGGRMKSMLIDVEVGVQSGYQREHVPMISLMSKLNDKAIVGHPIPIEALEDGSSDVILLDFQTLGYDAALQPWRTARRTAKCRVPRPPHLEEEEEEEYYDASSKGRKWPAPPKKPQRRSTSSFTTQKIRTLSSIGGSQHQHQHQHHHHHQQPKMELTGGEGMMMMKSESTAVACIPVKLVFSRLHEELVSPRHQ